MGLRFRKSVKLLPGVRVNLSLRGASMSLGQPGAVLNVSSRGVRATAGIPGTGLSYSTQLTSSSSATRRRSTRELAAEYRRIAVERQYAAAEAEAEEMERELEGLLNSWRDAPALVPERELRAALEPQPFSYDAAAPVRPNLAASRGVFEERLRSDAIAAHRRPHHAALVSILAGTALLVPAAAVLALIAGPSLEAMVSTSVGVLGGLTLHATLIGRWSRGVHERVTSGLAGWPTQRNALERAYLEQAAAHRSACEIAAREWSARERERISLLRRVLSGDVASIHAAVTSALEATAFPFDTDCEIALASADETYVRLDLPEIEDVVPEFRLRALRSGTVKEVKRKKADRCDAYAHLAAGLAVHIAGSVLSAAPTMQVVHIAAYTQRKQRGSNRIDDDYVYDVAVTRAFYAAIDLGAVSPQDALVRLGARFEQKKDGEFKKISPPAWVMELLGPEPSTGK